MSWLKRIIASRYIKSVVRYAIAALIAYLVPIPVLAPLADFLQENQAQLVEVIAGILVLWLGSWSVMKNKANAKINRRIIGAEVK